MYAAHFRLTGEAFSLTPDPSFLYLSPGHAEALAGLKIGLRGRRGLLVMIGEVGTGKTTLLYSLLSTIGAEVRTAYVANTALSFEDILRQALADFQVPYDSRDKLDLLQVLNAFLLRCAAEGATAALVIDEAQNLDDQTFENIRLLSNFESFTSKLLQIVLVGQPELDAKLRRASLRQVAERVAVRCHINPLTHAESCKYVAHRLECVGGSPEIFTRGALRLVVLHSQGIPRRINILCHNALLFAYGYGARRVSAAHVRAAVREWQGKGLITLGGRRSAHVVREPALAAGQGRSWPRRAWSVTAALLVVAALLSVVAAFRWNGRLAQGPAGATTPSGEAGGSRAQVLPDASKPEALQVSPPAPVPAVPDSNPGSIWQALVAPEKTSPEPAPACCAGLPPVDVRTLETAPVADVDPSAGQASGSAANVPDTHPQEEAPQFRAVPVAEGDTLVALAREIYGNATPEVLDRIKTANPQILDVNHILAGDTLRLPVANRRRTGARSHHE